MDSGSQQDNLTAASVDRTVVIRVEGRGSFRISPPIKQYVHRVIDSNAANRILIDMAECSSMDSTFMGVLAGLSFQLKDKAGFTLKLVNLSDKNQKLLTTLGVDRVVLFSNRPSEEEADLMSRLGRDVKTLGADDTDTLQAAKTTLEAHETLVNINPANLPKFKSVLELLQQDVDQLGGR